MVKVFCHSEAGGHAENEDAYGIQFHPADSNCCLVSIADGQGGRSGGSLASRLACSACLELAASTKPSNLLFPFTWNRILFDVDRAVAADAASGFTTLI